MPSTLAGRWLGLHRYGGSRALLLPGAAVHTLGLPGSRPVVALAPDGTVLAVRRVGANRVWWRRRAAWMLELGGAGPAPRVGARIELWALRPERPGERARAHRRIT